MTTTIENHVESSNIPKLDPEVMKRFRAMNSRQFVKYLVDGGNHQAEIKYYLTKAMHPDYVNQVLNWVTEELWFNQNKLMEIRKGPLKISYPSH